MTRAQVLAGALAAWVLGATCALAQDAPGVTRDTIKIGMFGPLTGSAAVFGKAMFGAEALYRDINDRGGIHGRKIEVVREDSACDPAKGIAAVKKLIAQDQVFMIHGGLCSGVVLSVKPEIVKSGIPFMVLGAASYKISAPTEANVFHPVATTATVGRAMIDFAMSKPGTKKIAVVSHSDDWGKSNRDPAVEHLKAAYNLESVADLTMERGSTDATPQVLKLRASGAEFVLAMLYPAETVIFLRDAYKYGVKTPTLGTQGVSLEDTRSRVGNPAAVDNFYVFYPFAAPTDAPAMEKWRTLIVKYFPNERIENFSFLGMGGALAVVEALQKAGPQPTREKVIAALNSIRGLETGVLSAPITFTPQEHAGVEGGAMVTYVGDKLVVLKKWQPKK